MIRVPLRLKIQRMGLPEIKKRLLNQFIRDGLRLAAEWWITECLPKHFAPGAAQRYQFAARSALFQRIKNRATRVRPWQGRTRGDWVPIREPKRPWVWSGDTMDLLLGRPVSEFNVKPVATTKKQTVKIPLPAPHAVTPEHAGELGRYTNDEFAKMHRIAFEYVKDQLQQIKDVQNAEFNW